MRLAALTVCAALAWTPALAAAHDDGSAGCTVKVGPGERFEQDRDLVVARGEQLEQALVLRGRVIVEPGATVGEVIAAGGDVVVRHGARVGKVVAVGGDVRLEGDARVDEDATSIGGHVQRSSGATVGGNVISLAFQMGDADLRRFIAEKLGQADRCTVVQVGPVAR